jgi:ABC-2 type transport system ATP-binding protein
MSAAIETRAVTKRFGAFTAVSEVSIRVEQGDVFGFLGPNGSGKTTLIKMLTGLLPVTSGEAFVDGVDVMADPEQVRRRIGYMSQQFSLYTDLTVLENLRFYGRVYGLRNRELNERIGAVLAINHLEPYRDVLSGRLSGGWKQRLALGCALLHEPRILFLDEPTAGIDPVARRELWDLLFDLSSNGITFLVTTHYMDEAERCNRLAYIYNSRLIAFGSPAEIKRLREVNPAGARRVEINCSDLMRALRTTSKIEGVRSATAFGQNLHALVDEALSDDTLIAALELRGVPGAKVRTISPTLEDAFVAITNEYRAALETGRG